MGQKVNPISNRLGVIRGWDSNWFGGKNFGDNLVEDQKIRKYLNERLAKASISRIIIERTLKLVTITICTARPGIVIGKGGQDVDKLKEELKKLYKKDIQINIFEVKKPELDATRKEMYKEGRTPLHTFRADIDYCQCEALTKVGLLGIKVWICRGEVYGKADLTPNFSQDNKSNNRGNGRSNNRGGNRKRNNNR